MTRSVQGATAQFLLDDGIAVRLDGAARTKCRGIAITICTGAAITLGSAGR